MDKKKKKTHPHWQTHNVKFPFMLAKSAAAMACRVWSSHMYLIQMYPTPSHAVLIRT